MDQNYDNEIMSIKIEARSRLFYIDLKKSPNGRFVKISEKSPKTGRSTIMFDEEDIDNIIDALTKIKEKCDSEKESEGGTEGRTEGGTEGGLEGEIEA